ncbi:UNVERIFIED_CONTAM: hypothetical protein Slati_2397500 [Sesamum latifolium]|uniref:Reverse transcriptase domain-containing protein n=1 Tax=Sesamum latifolium TaxID=2727402 RepID=A0AAW2WD08_9LAMI
MGSRMVKWSYELNEFDMEYHPRGAIKAQALVHFMVECPYKETPKAVWELYVDGSATNTQSGGGIILMDPEGEKLKFVIRYNELISNNEAEYETLLVGISAILGVALEGSSPGWFFPVKRTESSEETMTDGARKQKISFTEERKPR